MAARCVTNISLVLRNVHRRSRRLLSGPLNLAVSLIIHIDPHPLQLCVQNEIVIIRFGPRDSLLGHVEHTARK